MNGIQKVSFGSTQPVVEKKENPQPKKSSSYLVPGLVTGAVVGGAGSYFTDFGKESVDSVDKFVRSDKFEEDLKAVPGDKKANVDIIKEAKASFDEIAEVNAKLFKTLFPEGTNEIELSKIGFNQNSLNEMKHVLTEGASNAVKAEQDELTRIEEAASKLEKGKAGAVIIGDAENAIHIIKDEEGVVTFARGTATKNGEQLEQFVKNSGSAVELKAHTGAVNISTKMFENFKKTAEGLGITKDTTLNSKVTKEQYEKTMKNTTLIISDEIETAFENIKGHLPKTEVSNKLVLAYTAAGAALLGLIGYMMKKKEN